MLNIALPKGRLGKEVFDALDEFGYAYPRIPEDSRRLILESPENHTRYLMVKPSDVAIYVEHGVADIGIVGKDILLETKPRVYELLDLKLGMCSMAVITPRDFCDDMDRTLRVATKYVNIAKDYYTSLNREVQVIKLMGSVELAPILGLSDVIVDIVETGTTARENHLRVAQRITDISARLIANPSGFKFKNKVIRGILDRWTEVLDHD